MFIDGKANNYVASDVIEAHGDEVVRSPGDWRWDTEHWTLNTARNSGLTMEVGQDFQHRVIKQGRLGKGQT